MPAELQRIHRIILDAAEVEVFTGEWEIGASTRTWSSRPSALVLIAYRHRSDDLLGSRGDQEEAKAQFQKSWDAGEGVGEAGRGTVSAISGRGRRKHG